MKKKRELPTLEGRRQTAGRREILAAVVDMKGHFDPQTLHERLRAKGSKVSRASVYRTIPILVEQGIISEVEKTEKHAHYEKTMSNMHEVRAREAQVIAVVTKGDRDVANVDAIEVPVVEHEVLPLVTVIPLQLLSYFIADIKGTDVDQPRNLAKTVTVE